MKLEINEKIDWHELRACSQAMWHWRYWTQHRIVHRISPQKLSSVALPWEPLCVYQKLRSQKLDWQDRSQPFSPAIWSVSTAELWRLRRSGNDNRVMARIETFRGRTAKWNFTTTGYIQSSLANSLNFPFKVLQVHTILLTVLNMWHF